MASGTFILKIDSAQVDSTLTNFPVMIYLSSSSGTGSFDATHIFTDLGSNSKKIKVKNSSGTELYCEIEMWDETTEKAVLHVKVDSVSSSTDTELSLEWDSTWADNTSYVGNVNEGSVPESVWDSDFVAVYHMSDDPTASGRGYLADSTANDYHMYHHGMTSGDLVDADYGKALEFDGSDDWLESNISIQRGSNAFTLEAVMSKTDFSGATYGGWVVSHREYDSNDSCQIFYNTDNKATVGVYDSSDSICGADISPDADGNGTFIYLAATTDGLSGNTLSLYKDGSLDATDTLSANVHNPNIKMAIGNLWAGTAATGTLFEGKIAEIRYSKVNRGAAWIKATNASLTDSLVSFSMVVSLPALGLGASIGIGPIIGDLFTTLPPVPFSLYMPPTPISQSIPAASMEMELSMDIGGAFLVRYVPLSPLNLGMSLDFGNVTQNIVLSPLDMGLTLAGSPLQSIPIQPFGLGLAMDFGDISSFETGSAIIRYFCILTGAADGTTDLTLPMSSFQARRRSGDPTYLSVVIPTVDYADEISARPNGTLKIQQAYEQNGVIKQTETIMETSLDEVNPDEGGTNQSVTLIGYSTSTYSAKAVTLSGVTYRSTRAGKYNYRLAKPYIFLNPGDTVTFEDDGVTFVIDTMSYFINPATSTIELAST